MDRETRKANLKKLQLPGTAGASRQQRKTRQNTKTTNGTTTISNYFLTPEKEYKTRKSVESEENPAISKNILEKRDQDVIEVSDNSPLKPDPKNTRSKRTKLDTFIFKDSKNIPESLKNCKKSLNDDDLVVPEKKVKKAPKLPTPSETQIKQRARSSKTKKQTTIKSAFLRNEQMFAEIAAQHCAADQFDGDDVQLALAISKSEAESKGITCVEDHNKEDIVDNCQSPDLIREKLKKYGFKTAEKKDYTTFAAAFLPKPNGRRTKSKWANKFTALTLRNTEVQNKKLQENIQTLLNQQFRTKPLTEGEQNLPKYKLQSLLLKKCDMENSGTVLENFDNHKKPYEQYFVTELFEISKLSAGHLLKDWSAIQGRDLTPTTKSQQTRERSVKLQNIYKELEIYFSSRKILEWTITNETKVEEEKLQETVEVLREVSNDVVDTETVSEINNDNNLATIKSVSLDNNLVEEEIEDHVDHDQDPKSSLTHTYSNDVIEEILPTTKTLDIMNISSCIELSGNIKKKEDDDKTDLMKDVQNNDRSSIDQIKYILPPTKSLDIMHVSSGTIRTEATFNSTQTRSHSPDLFADSDVEMEDNIINKDQKDIDVVKGNKSNSSLEDNVGVTTYEIFSSDEVKNISSLETNNQSVRRETSLPDQVLLANISIDLTQDDLEKQGTQLNQSKSIAEIDLFADSPLQEDTELVTDINSNSQQSKYIEEQKESIFKLTLSSETTDQEKETLKENTGDDKKEDYFKLTLSMETKNCDVLGDSDDDDDFVLREIAMDQTNTTFLNFQGSKQLETYFHKETAAGDTKEILKESLSGNDTIFRELCNKYLKDVSPKTYTSFNKTDTSLRKSFTQPLPKIKTPNKIENITDTCIDTDMVIENNKCVRKSNLSSDKDHKKSKYSYDSILSKSQPFFNNKSDDSIDLTQNDEDDIFQDEDEDDCLILSDDEINYSIWQANKTENFEASKLSDNELCDAVSIPDHCINQKDSIVDFPQNNHIKFDYMDLLPKEISVMKKSLDTKKSFSDIETTITKERKSSKFEFDRSEFGILEEYSEPIDFTPSLCTPTKEHLNDVSFLDSPTEKTEPMKRYSNCHKSTQKFNELLNSIDKHSPMKNDFDEVDDFDEFDRLIYQNSVRKTNSTKKPQGLEQLLTAEISFKGSQYTSPRKKTPVKSKHTYSEKQELNVNNKTYVIRYTSSPKPDYTQLPESELLKYLYNFGIKPLNRKQAVKILEYIYNQTHPIVVDDGNDDKSENQIDDIITLEDFDKPSTSKSLDKILSKTEQNFGSSSITTSEKNINKRVAGIVANKLNLQDSCGMDMLRYSIDLKAELFEENYILQTNVTKKTPQPLLPFHIAWYNLVCSNPKLHETILMYEPIDLQQIYLFLKCLGYRYDPKDLKIFFDRRCIIFRYDLTGSNGKTKDNNRHIRKSKKQKLQTNKLK